MVAGITGRSGSGKSYVAQIFAQYGFTVIDLDAVSRSVTTVGSVCLNEITDTFSKDILLPDGALNRRALGEIVFNNEQKLKTLNDITHKYILEDMERIIAETNGDILIDAPLLFEAGLDKRCDFTIGVIADDDILIKRISTRDKISAETAAARLDKQHSNSFFAEKCTYIIENNETSKQLEQKTKELIHLLREVYNG
ncbi:MAG: dephospho-CoA kinase [Clostridia bacterium]|nr:dephospho-CoA kinase [Clostridia bacterium]